MRRIAWPIVLVWVGGLTVSLVAGATISGMGRGASGTLAAILVGAAVGLGIAFLNRQIIRHHLRLRRERWENGCHALLMQVISADEAEMHVCDQDNDHEGVHRCLCGRGWEDH